MNKMNRKKKMHAVHHNWLQQWIYNSATLLCLLRIIFNMEALQGFSFHNDPGGNYIPQQKEQWTASRENITHTQIIYSIT